MPDTPDQPTRSSETPARTPFEGETLDAPPPPELLTATDQTHSHAGDPPTASLPRAGGGAAWAEPPGFMIVRELGSGGMGVVFEARQVKLNRRVALKVLRSGRDNPRDVIRFIQEAEAVAAIKHPHVVQVFDHGQHAGGPYIVFELLTGGTLADRLRDRGRFEPREAAALVAKLAGAVQAAHDGGIFHRDLKPGNVLFDEKGEPKVTDFGLAKQAGGPDITRTQAVMGTPAYMAPEQARGDAHFVGPPADIWALGAILYECLTGKRAFDADDTWAVLRKVTDEAPLAPRVHAPGLPRDLELIALKCLEKNPADRYPSAAALAADLESYLAGRPVSVRPTGPRERFVKWCRRNPAVAALTASVALALVVGSAVSLAFALQAERRRGEVAKANADLTRTNDDLTKSRDDLTRTTGELKNTVVAVNAARHELLKYAGDLKDASAAAEERGYLSDVALAHQLWKANDLSGMRVTLERCPPSRRKWEWYYLDRLSRPEFDFRPTDSMPLALAYSPDGKWLARLTVSGMLVVRDRVAEVDRHTVFGKPDTLSRDAVLAFHPKSTELAYTVNGRVRVVDLANGEWREPEAPDTGGQPGAAVAVGYAPGGQLLVAVASDKKGVRHFAIYDLFARKKLSDFPGYESPKDGVAQMTCAGFSPDGKLFAVSAADSGINVRGANDPPKEPSTFHPRVFVWDVETGKLVGQPSSGSSIFAGFAFDPDSRAVALGRGGEITEFTLAPKQYSRQIPGHTGNVLAFAYDRNGLIWSGGDDKMIRAHDRKTGAERFAIRGCSRSVLRLAVSPDGKELAAASGDVLGLGGSVDRFDISTFAADSWRAPVTRDQISLVAALAPGGARFAALDLTPFDERPGSQRFVVRDLAGGKEVAVTPAGNWLRGAFATDGRLFVLERQNPLDKQEQVRVIGPDGKPGRAVAPPGDANGLHRSSVIACTPDGRSLAVVTGDTLDKNKLRARLHTWDANTLAPLASGEADLSDLLPPEAKFAGLYPGGTAVDRDGKRLAATFTAMWQHGRPGQVDSRGAVVVWDLATGKEVFRKVVAQPLRAVAFDTSGRLAAGGGLASGGVLFGWDVATGAEFLSMRSHTRPVTSLAFGPDNRLFTGGADRVVKVWDLTSKREVLTLDGFLRDVVHLAFTKDGKNLVAATGLDVLGAMTAEGTPTDWPPAEVRVFRGPK